MSWGKEARMVFFEKKNQRPFDPGSVTCRDTEDIKVFCFFFSEKKALL